MQEGNLPHSLRHANRGKYWVHIIKKAGHHLQISKKRRIKTFRRATLDMFDSSE